MQEIDLYRPSLTKKWRPVKSFNIKSFILIAVFGGVIPFIILGTINARWLRAPGKDISLFVSAGLLLEAIKWLLFLQSSHGVIPVDYGPIHIGYRIACVFLFIYYYQLMKKPFHFYLRTNSVTETLVQPGVYLIALGLLIDFASFVFIL